jgi:hypothetical protein
MKVAHGDAAGARAGTTYDMQKYEILVDKQTITAFHGGPVPWTTDQSWRASGMDPSLFPNGMIPLKRVLMEDGENHHTIAAKYYALAHRAEKVTGPPHWLITFEIPIADTLVYLFEGKAIIDHYPETLGLTRLITPETYPALTATAHPLMPDFAEYILQQGYDALNSQSWTDGSTTRIPTSPSTRGMMRGDLTLCTAGWLERTVAEMLRTFGIDKWPRCYQQISEKNCSE